MRRRNKLKGKKLSDRIFLLLAACLALYVFAANKGQIASPEVLPKDKQIVVPEEEKTPSLADQITGSVEQKENPHGMALDFKQGEGDPVQCGQEVQVRYRTLLLDGTPLEDFLEKGAPVQLKIGESKAVIPGVPNYTMGMRLGGERQVTLPPEMAYDSPEFRRKDVPLGSAAMLRLKLMGVKEEKALTAAEGYSLFNIVQAASRKQAWCGEEVSVLVHNITGRNVHELLPSAEGYTTRFTLGSRSVPLWLEQSVVGDGRFKPLGLGGYRGIHLTDDVTESKTFREWEGATKLNVKIGEDAVLRVHVTGVGNETIDVQEPVADAESSEGGWKHDKPDEAATPATREVAPEEKEKEKVDEVSSKPEAEKNP